MKTAKKPTLRKCVGCKEMIDVSQLIRLSCDPNDGNFVLDIQGSKKAPGRGAYICKSQECFAKAQKSKGLERSFKRAIPTEIYEQLKTEIVAAAGFCPA